MITEDYCSPEVSKLLDEKGFNEECDNFYSIPIKDLFIPTHQLAMKWLRDKHHIHIMILIGFDEDKMFYYSNLAQFNTDKITYSNPIKTYFSTCEEAVEAMLKYVLENLI